MVARGEARLCERNPWTRGEYERSPGGAAEPTAKVLSPLRGSAILCRPYQGLRSQSLAHPWLPSVAPSGGYKTNPDTAREAPR
jgi:hypothetical protein